MALFYAERLLVCIGDCEGGTTAVRTPRGTIDCEREIREDTCMM